jgi:hypothetical protein
MTMTGSRKPAASDPQKNHFLSAPDPAALKGPRFGLALLRRPPVLADLTVGAPPAMAMLAPMSFGFPLADLQERKRRKRERKFGT